MVQEAKPDAVPRGGNGTDEQAKSDPLACGGNVAIGQEAQPDAVAGARDGADEQAKPDAAASGNGVDQQNEPKASELTPRQAFQQLVQLANAGDEAALAKLRELLDRKPEIWQDVGDIARHAEQALIRAIAGNDRLLSESLQRKRTQLKQELTSGSPTPLEKMAVDRIVACLLQMQHADTQVTRSQAGTVQAEFWLKRQVQAHRQYDAALKSLMLVEKLLPADHKRGANGRASQPNTNRNASDKQAVATEAPIDLDMDPLAAVIPIYDVGSQVVSSSGTSTE